MDGRQFQFEWDAKKATANLRKHGVPFELACTVFYDPLLLTVADLEPSEAEERWFSVGRAGNGAMLSVCGLRLMWQPRRSALFRPERRRRPKFGSTRKAYEQPNER